MCPTPLLPESSRAPIQTPARCGGYKSGPSRGSLPTLLSVSFLPTADCRACSRASTSPSHSRSRRRASAPSELTFLGGQERACGLNPVGTLPPALGSCLQRLAPHSQGCQQTREPGSEWQTAGPGPGARLHPRGVGAPLTPRGLSLCSSGLCLSGTSQGVTLTDRQDPEDLDLRVPAPRLAVAGLHGGTQTCRAGPFSDPDRCCDQL